MLSLKYKYSSYIILHPFYFVNLDLPILVHYLIYYISISSSTVTISNEYKILQHSPKRITDHTTANAIYERS